MEESLKSVRSIHLALLAVCAAICVFAASPRKLDAFSRAKAEIEALRDLDLSDLQAWINQQINEQTPDLHWLKADQLFPGGKVTASLATADLFPVRYSNPGLLKLTAESKLEDWLKSLDSDLMVSVQLPNQADSSFIEFCKRLRDYAKTKPGASLESLTFKNGSEGDLPSDPELPAYAECQTSNSLYRDIITAPVPFTSARVIDDAFGAWIAHANSAFKLRAILNTPGTYCPAIRAIRNEVGVLSIPQAAQYLEERIANQARKIDVFGASVDEPLAVVAAPLAALLALLYFALHLEHLRDQIVAVGASETCSFPWVGSFPGPLAAVITYGSTWLPLGACLWLLWGARTYASVATRVTTLTIIIGISAAALFATRQIAAVRNLMGAAPVQDKAPE